MNAKILILSFCLLISFHLSAQDSLKKANSVIYGEAGIGVPLAGISGIQFNFAINYEYKRSLFTFSYRAIDSYRSNNIFLSPVTTLPLIQADGSLDEYALLYGRRFINKGFSFSYSAGFSLNDRVSPHGQLLPPTEDHYVGVPFEINILWFKPIKKRYRVYGMIPVGKPTGFGGSFGFKLSGNFSRHSYAAAGIVFGQGYHRSY